ncbi:hypothetical protein L210DRAFT_940489 [Boletus edulis BED1]|uniref:Uncharacterized protein n=1 Tax=Boletus edulis BED1 TaxID=1328754 RepID=A0AAD4GIV6_BOLED|nr:hypothetical protein L210DRAFT_940489 [Boletus edulis BED1]
MTQSIANENQGMCNNHLLVGMCEDVVCTSILSGLCLLMIVRLLGPMIHQAPTDQIASNY